MLCAGNVFVVSAAVDSTIYTAVGGTEPEVRRPIKAGELSAKISGEITHPAAASDLPREISATEAGHLPDGAVFESVSRYRVVDGVWAWADPDTYADPDTNACPGNSQRGRGQPDATSDHSQWLYGGER